MNMSKKRIAALQALLQQDGMDAAIYATSPAFIYLLDIPTFWTQRYGVTQGPKPGRERPTLTRPETMLYVPAVGEPVVFTIPQDLLVKMIRAVQDFQFLGLNGIRRQIIERVQDPHDMPV